MPQTTILVVDDESHVTQMLSKRLAVNDIRVLTANDGEDAYEISREEKPDLIITDLRMPGMNGIDMAKALRHHPTTSEIPILVLTGHSHMLKQEHYDETNIKAMMAKPFSPRKLTELINELTGCLLPFEQNQENGTQAEAA